LAFEVQELPDLIRIFVLLDLSRANALTKSSLKQSIDKHCFDYMCVDMHDVDKTISEMSREGLLTEENGILKLTEKGLKLGKEWRNLLLKREPILEIVAGLTDGSITGLVVIISAFLAGLATNMATFAAVLSLSAVAITNFSSFLMGGKTEDIADLLTLETLMHYSLSDIPDLAERDKSLNLVRQLFILLHKEIGRTNFYAALVSGLTTYLAGIIPIVAYLTMPYPLNIILSLSIVCFVVVVFLVRYRSERTKVHWKVTLVETATIITIAVIASIIIGRI